MQVKLRLTSLARTLIILISGLVVSSASPGGTKEPAKVAVVFDDTFNKNLIKGNDVRKRCEVHDGKLHVSVRAGDASPIAIEFEQPMDVSAYRYLLTQVSNTGAETIVLRIYVRDSASRDYESWGHYSAGVAVIRPGETKPLAACLDGPRPAYAYMTNYFPMMNRLPGMFELNFWRTIDSSTVAGVRLMPCGAGSRVTRSFALGPLHGAAPISAPKEEELKNGRFFPFIDRYGQYNKADWPDKIRRDADLAVMLRKENAWRAAQPAMPTGWDKYGGWAAGPKLKATGHFRTEKYQDKWWFVDPEGHLFWSKGCTGMGFSIGGETSLSPDQRRRFFADIQSGAVTGNKKGEQRYKIGSQIEELKYGRQNGKQREDALTISRAWSFGLNTAGAWSQVESTGTHGIPYTLMIHSWSSLFREKLYDPFDSSFKEGLDKAIAATRKTAAEDPWCLGYFINNELAWGPSLVLGKIALEHDPGKAAKAALLNQLKSHYSTIEELNRAWGRSFSSWEALKATRDAGALNKTMEKDLTRFGEHFCDTFFRTIKEAMTRNAPHKLYLGDRFNKNAPDIIRACARYADVVSFNKYEWGLEGFSLPKECDDRPVIVGEFSFVRGGRRHDSADLGEAFDQDYRGRAYAQYVKGALENPAIVGCHWFQWGTQPLSGRGDGENYEQGFIDTCDTPYWQLAEYSRDLADHMYTLRLSGESDFDYAPPSRAKAVDTKNR